ncbi:hypothetical protein [Tellurirhabdus bombi]|uniref:hypothetical protein n=1 Tax=Tellurirhabdus bombi TaxID=2907205 RepID=UPI001F24F453|nr:hypothetical protein [Tellurirhabdus bombi]
MALPIQNTKSFSAHYISIALLRNSQNIAFLKKGIWLYFFLLIFEGALRKWFLPGLATPLLLVRDPIAIWLFFLAYKNNLFRSNGYIFCALLITIVSLVTTILFGHGNLTVAIYGARIMLIQFPFLFLIGQIFTFYDVLKIGKVLLWITIPMTILIASQFYSPQSAWVNRGIGGDMEGAGFSGAMGYFRPPGTFSFTNGLVSFYGLAAAFIFYFWLDSSKQVKKILLYTATACLLAAIPLSISRTVLFEVVISILFTLFIASRKPKYLLRIVGAVIGVLLFFVLLSNLSFFQTSILAFADRFTSANENEGGLEGVFLDRFLGGMVGAILEIDAETSFWGQGIGMGTNAGATLMTGKQVFLISETEWGRLIGEMGILLGVGAVILRTILTYQISYSAYKAIKKENYLPWLILSFAFINVLQGQWAQPTSLGFAIFSGGLVLAALKK